MVRRLGLAGVMAVVAAAFPLVWVATPSSAACGNSPCRSAARVSVTPQDVLTGSTTQFAVTVFNDLNVTLDSVRIVRPSTDFTITQVVSPPPGWTGNLDAPDGASWATFSSPVGLAPGQTITFQLQAAAAMRGTDATAAWAVLGRDKAANLPNNNNYAAIPGENNSVASLQETIHVLSTTGATFSPNGARDGTVTAGQPVSATLPVTNLGTAPVTLSTADSTVTGDTPGTVSGGRLTVPVSIGPGATATATFAGITFVSAGTGVVVRFSLANSALPVRQGAARSFTVQTPATFQPHQPDPFGSDLSCSPGPINPGRGVTCTLDVDK